MGRSFSLSYSIFLSKRQRGGAKRTEGGEAEPKRDRKPWEWARHGDKARMGSPELEPSIKEVKEIGDGIEHGDKVGCSLPGSVSLSKRQRDRAREGRGQRGKTGEGVMVERVERV